MPSSETSRRIKQVIRESLKLGPEAHLADDMPLNGGDYDLDSLDILLLVTSIEKEFGIKVEDKAMGKQVFSSIATLAEFVESHTR